MQSQRKGRPFLRVHYIVRELCSEQVGFNRQRYRTRTDQTPTETGDWQTAASAADRGQTGPEQRRYDPESMKPGRSARYADQTCADRAGRTG